jgi:hypothetical protein
MGRVVGVEIVITETQRTVDRGAVVVVNVFARARSVVSQSRVRSEGQRC